ncbi:MAG TPA: sugar phosphate isomerase/epimerase family protein [bacterium]|nr:sugar phosphate isomerase/epimerase family protein [bacterium]HPN43307.1 sugar phosphate isomerase/epimerase family protein [bacterium]
MLKTDRRQFIKQIALSLGALSYIGLGSSCNKKQPGAGQPWNGFKYAMCNESMQSLSWQEQCKIIADAGYKGVEIAPFTLVQQSLADLDSDKRRELRTIMEESGLQCAGLHWLLAPPPPNLHFTTPDKKTRDNAISYLYQLIDFCAAMGGEVMVFGSPKQRSTQGIPVAEAKKYFAEGLSLAATYAQQNNVKILIEPLDKSQSDVVNTLAEALQIVKIVDHPAVQLMFDFHNTPDETQPCDELVNRFLDYIFHVHVQEMDGKHLRNGNKVDEFIKTFQILKNRNYSRWISVEVFDFTPGGQIIARESMQTLRAIERQLV